MPHAVVRAGYSRLDPDRRHIPRPPGPSVHAFVRQVEEVGLGAQRAAIAAAGISSHPTNATMVLWASSSAATAPAVGFGPVVGTWRHAFVVGVVPIEFLIVREYPELSVPGVDPCRATPCPRAVPG